jgi:hypothetical protein
MNNPCKYKAFEKKVKGFCPQTSENVDKMKFLLISQRSKPSNTMGFRKYPTKSPQEIAGIHGFSASQLESD